MEPQQRPTLPGGKSTLMAVLSTEMITTARDVAALRRELAETVLDVKEMAAGSCNVESRNGLSSAAFQSAVLDKINVMSVAFEQQRATMSAVLQRKIDLAPIVAEFQSFQGALSARKGRPLLCLPLASTRPPLKETHGAPTNRIMHFYDLPQKCLKPVI